MKKYFRNFSMNLIVGEFNMKRVLSFHLALLLLLSSLPLQAQKNEGCENGECVNKIVHLLEDLGAVYKRQCLPSGIKESEIKAYHENNPLSEECWKIITEIIHHEKELDKHQNKLLSRLGCENGDCKDLDSQSSINAQIRDLENIENSLSCTEVKKAEVEKQCPQDLTCSFVAGATGIGGTIISILIPKDFVWNNCDLRNDSCMSQVSTSFLNSTISFFDSSWDLLKILSSKAKQSLSEFWTSTTSSENHSSSSQLALANASEDPGVFDMLVNDFSGTMDKLWSAFVASIKLWMKTDVFCQKWSGTPHLSNCTKPLDTFDCISCKETLRGLCAISGPIVSEVVPAFLTGGLSVAAKYGAKGASQIAKLFRISPSALETLKNSRMAQIAISTSTKIDDAIAASKNLKTARAMIEGSLQTINKFSGSPTRKFIKKSSMALSSLAEKGSVYVAKGPTGNVLTFSAEAAKKLGKAVIYPVDNPMTAFAFNEGKRNFDKIFKLGAPKLTARTAVTSALVSQSNSFEDLVIKLEELRSKNGSSKDFLALEEKLVASIGENRKEFLKNSLQGNNVEFEDIIKYLYPELQYGDLARKTNPDKIFELEKELYLELQSNQKLLDQYSKHVVDGQARSSVLGKTSPSYKEIVDNSQLSDEERFTRGMKDINRVPKSLEEKMKLSIALEEAHRVAPDKGVFEYSWPELRQKYNILTQGGFTDEEANRLIRSGFAGRPPVRELIKPGDTLFSGFASDVLKKDYFQKRDELMRLLSKDSKAVMDNLDSMYFIDYSDHVDELNHFLKGEKNIVSSKMSSTYDHLAFENFKKARDYLLKERPEINKKTLLEIHRRMMAGGLDNVNPSDLGIIRKDIYYGDVPPDYAIDSEILKTIEENPYLRWVQKGKTSDGKFYGEIYYPNPHDIKKEGLDLIRKNHPQLVREIEEYQSVPILKKQKRAQFASLPHEKLYSPEGIALKNEIEALERQHAALTRETYELTKRLVDAMVDDLMDWFTRERTLIGDIDSPEKLDRFSNLVAKFQRDLVSIHPLPDGNGRSTRELALSYAMMKEGLPPPRIIDPNADIYRSLDDWKKIIKHGVLSTDYLMDDLTERLKYGLPVENSMELISPYSRPPVKVGLKHENQVSLMNDVEYIDPRFYREVLKRELKLNPGLKNDFKENPVKAWDQLHKKTGEIFSKNNLYYIHPENGIERVAVGYVDEDFKFLFGKPSFNNKELFDFKLKTWYSDEINWKGVPTSNSEVTESQIVQMFTELTPAHASDSVLKKAGMSSSPEQIRKSALEDFEEFNEDVFNVGLSKKSSDHKNSYGYSTSKNPEVEKNYAKGSGPTLLIGAKRANKDLDVDRLRQVREDFSKSQKVQEVIGIGACDPDAVTIIQKIDVNGEVTFSYLRNKNNPKEIMVIRGEVRDDIIPEHDKIVKTITLQ